jgi:hypothetical protein
MGELREQGAPGSRAAVAADRVRTDLQQAPRGLAIVEALDLRAQVREQPWDLLLGIDLRDRLRGDGGA